MAVILVSLWVPALPCLAGESYLDRNSKVHDAIPYGRTIDETPSQTGGRKADDPQSAAPAAATPSIPAEPARDEGAGTGSSGAHR